MLKKRPKKPNSIIQIIPKKRQELKVHYVSDNQHTTDNTDNQKNNTCISYPLVSSYLTQNDLSSLFFFSFSI